MHGHNPGVVTRIPSGDLMKHGLWGPAPELLTQQVWGGPENLNFYQFSGSSDAAGAQTVGALHSESSLCNQRALGLSPSTLLGELGPVWCPESWFLHL